MRIYISEWIGGCPLLGLASGLPRARLRFLASTSPEDLISSAILFAWAEIPSGKGAPKLRIVLLINPSTA
jgi:hypothetical protein